MSNYFTARKAQRDCVCRGCDKRMKKNVDDVIHTYSSRNRGQHILFCFDCGKLIGNMHLDYLNNGCQEITVNTDRTE
jgi:hypothetical protein